MREFLRLQFVNTGGRVMVESFEYIVKNLSNIMMENHARNVQWNKRRDHGTEHHRKNL